MDEIKNPFEGANIPPQVKNLFGNLKVIIIGAVAVVAAFSSFYTVEPEEVGVVQRFGEFVRTAESGLNYKIPFVETVEIVPVERQLKQEFGYRTVTAGVQSRYQKSGYVDESLMLTGDLNLADVEWVVQYRIEDAYQYLFKVRNPDKTLRDISEAAMRQVVGNRTVNEALTVGRAEIALRVQDIIQQLNADYENGIRVEQVVLQDINPPDKVKPSFNQVNEAQQQRETLINEARADYNRVIPRARGQALETIQQAEGYAAERVNRARGEVVAFNELFTEYTRAPQVTKQRIYFETMQEILPNIGSKIVTDQDGTGALPLLQMQIGNGNKNQPNQSQGGNN